MMRMMVTMILVLGSDDGNEADTEDCLLVDKSDIHQYGANCVDPRH